jgi:hypothetical protein
LFLGQERWTELDDVAVRLDRVCRAAVEASVVRARGCLARREFAKARQQLEETIASHPQVVMPRPFLTHALLQEGQDWPAAEKALRDLLALAPEDVEAHSNLSVLLRGRGHPSPG